MDYWVLAFYKFTCVEDPHRWVKEHKNYFKNRDVTCRIYISEEGVNGQLSAYCTDAKEYIEWLRAYSGFADVDIKVHKHHENVFPRITVKYRKQLVALDLSVDLKDSGDHLSPREWREHLEGDEEYLLLDVRNAYEGKVGCFEGAEIPDCETFREFPDYLERLKERVNPEKTKVMMYCTGGIRCELYSVLMKQQGFERVYQLEGGVIKYGLEEGNKHWKGKLFVFDDRLVVPISEDPHESIGKCHFCDVKTDAYYNCANMDCNELFLSCPECLKALQGCCCTECQEAPRVRSYEEQVHPKPFRRWHIIQKEICESSKG